VNDPLASLEASFRSALSESRDLQALADLRVSVLGKKGTLTAALRGVADLPPPERPAFGARVNELRGRLEEALSIRQMELEAEAVARSIENDRIDVTLPGNRPDFGTLHPLTHVERRIVAIFRSLGFSVAEGPDIETDYHNFEALNFPPEHPARDMQDTFFLGNDLLLRTHTSPVQIRTMEAVEPPLRIVIPGRVYRHDSDTTHSPVFHQVEGLAVGPDITFAHLKGTLEAFIRLMFGEGIQTRFRPSFFPFTEPSAELDVMGPRGWMEILGCGMVDPNVFEAVGKAWKEKGRENPYDPANVSGFAFGMGIERIAMILYGITDIRLFYENDVRFLRQFRS
jgi:phenylalanyl-tRNA synthetase alpha chain